ncbi:MAG TPA: FeoA family protein [Gemmataceae bacterium]|nr:FeoA family protein [Gemmataceae bacterium]
MDHQNLLPIEYLASGTWAEVADVSGEPAWVRRLAELGIRAGSRLQMLQPGTPCLLEVAGARLSVRADVAMQILVRPQGCAV